MKVMLGYEPNELDPYSIAQCIFIFRACGENRIPVIRLQGEGNATIRHRRIVFLFIATVAGVEPTFLDFQSSTQTLVLGSRMKQDNSGGTEITEVIIFFLIRFA